MSNNAKLTDSPSIKRRDKHTPGPDFNSLRRDAIELVQALSGEFWTDYNLHDPGVTILEQLCYALTDLTYRSDFSVEDVLTGPEGKIDYNYQSLHPPEQIFSCRPTTCLDYRKAILDAVANIDNVWLKPVQPSSGDTNVPRGLYDIEIRPKRSRPGATTPSTTELKHQVLNTFHRLRNLGEDVGNVVVLDVAECTLIADIEVQRGRHPEDILAEIYSHCLRLIAGNVEVVPFEECSQRGETLEEIFRGPYTAHGVFSDAELGRSQHVVTVGRFSEKRDELIAQCFSIISAIDGVDHVKTIDLVLTGNEQSPPSTAVLQLNVPGEDHDGVSVNLYMNDRVLPIGAHAISAALSEWDFKYQAQRQRQQDVSTLYTMPTGEHRPTGEYYSIQNHFPMLYGINRYGLPASASAQEKARAAQLKGYLLLFEQVMANFNANLHDLRNLFSPVQIAKQSYRYQVLDDDIVPNIAPLYASPPDQALADALAQHDNYAERKNRVLDYLLALYGEKFTQKSLRYFNYYNTDTQPNEALLHNKQALLADVVALGRDRAGAFNHTQASWNSDNVSGLEKRVGILLGMKYLHARSLTDVFVEQGLELISDAQFARVKEGTVELAYVDLSDIEERIHLEFREPPPRQEPPHDYSALFENIIFLKNNLVSQSILQSGVFPNHYRIGGSGGDGDVQLVLKPSETGRWIYLASYRSEQAANAAANDLRHFLIHLNIESEGMHIVEHVLLRPLSTPEHCGPPLSRDGQDEYSFRLSAIFPAWTARCANPQFRHLAEETVRLNCPAHIEPQIYWLDFAAMAEFELLYRHWLELKRQPPEEFAALDEASRQLLAFLLQRRPTDG